MAVNLRTAANAEHQEEVLKRVRCDRAVGGDGPSLVTGQGTPGRQDFRRFVEMTLVVLVTLLVNVTG